MYPVTGWPLTCIDKPTGSTVPRWRIQICCKRHLSGIGALLLFIHTSAHFLQVLRSLLGFAFPLFGSQMYKVMGLGGGNSVRCLIYNIPYLNQSFHLIVARRPCHSARHSVSNLDILQRRSNARKKLSDKVMKIPWLFVTTYYDTTVRI